MFLNEGLRHTETCGGEQVAFAINLGVDRNGRNHAHWPTADCPTRQKYRKYTFAFALFAGSLGPDFSKKQKEWDRPKKGGRSHSSFWTAGGAGDQTRRVSTAYGFFAAIFSRRDLRAEGGCKNHDRWPWVHFLWQKFSYKSHFVFRRLYINVTCLNKRSPTANLNYFKFSKTFMKSPHSKFITLAGFFRGPMN